MPIDQLYNEAVRLLSQLISIPSYSKYEGATADAIERFFQEHGVQSERHLHNVWAANKYFDAAKPTILLNSHHDTVKPNPQYSKDPFSPIIEEGKLFGLGSNDAGGCLVSLIATFLHYYDHPNLTHNLVIAATAEEEISGYNGIEALLQDEAFQQAIHTHYNAVHNGPAGCIVGEPTLMNLAIAEKGLMVLDCVAHGRAGHAAREEGANAIYKAMKDINWFSSYTFDRISEWLGPIKMSVTVIHTENKAHNMVPSQCSYVVDVRVTEKYTHEEVYSIIRQHVSSDVMPRSMRMRSTEIDVSHPLVQAGIALGKTCYGSPTSSDKALMPFQALKCGPGDSGRSHTADEFIYLHEIEKGIRDYINILDKVIT
jgi:acetylornithine deacetylase